MPDTLKVFANRVGQAVTPTVAAHSVPLITTDASTKAVVKDLQFSYTAKSPYSRKTTLSLDGFPLYSASDVDGFNAGGSLIIGGSSNLSLEVDAETEILDYGRLQGLIEGVGGTLFYVDYDYIMAPEEDLDVAAIYSTITLNAVSTGVSPDNSYSTATFVRDGIVNFCSSTGSQVKRLGKDGSTLGAFSFPTTIYAICADDTYVYGISTGAQSDIYRYNHTTLSAASNLTTGATIRGYGASNKGFIAYYDGFVYTKANGSDGNVQIINTSTGAVTTQPVISESEAIGGAITVARDGVAWLIHHGDTTAEAIRISDWSRTTFSTGMSPTTTNSNQCVCIGPGLVLVNDGTYGRSCIINMNSGSPVVTDAGSILPLGNQYSLLAATPFLGGDGPSPRNLDHSVLVAGVEVT